MRLRCYLREIRGTRKLTELAEASGVAQPYLSQIERGERVPRDDWLDGIERAYGEPLEDWYHPRVLAALRMEDE